MEIRRVAGSRSLRKRLALLGIVVLALGVAPAALTACLSYVGALAGRLGPLLASPPGGGLRPSYSPRPPALENSGFSVLTTAMDPWPPETSLEQISAIWKGAGERVLGEIDRRLAEVGSDPQKRIPLLVSKASMLNSEGEPERSY